MPKLPSSRRPAAAAYQKEYRAKLKAARSPSRDDIARVALHWVITQALKNEPENLPKFRQAIVALLVDQGFARTKAEAKFDALCDSYEDGWSFQRKPHLLSDGEA